MTDPASAPFRHVYHLSPARLVIFPIMWVLLVGLSVVGTLNSAEGFTPGAMRMLLILVGLATVFLLPFLGLMWQSRLVLTAEGIAHHQFGYTVRSSWSNLARLDLTPAVQRIILSEPGTRSRLLSASVSVMNVAAPGLAGGVVGDADAYSEGRLIGLAPFMWHWKHGPLRDDLLRHAPHLFDADGKPRSSSG